jgi:hypothetical protein
MFARTGGIVMIRFKTRAAVVAALALLTVPLGPATALGGTASTVAYRGWTTQTFPHKSQPIVVHGVIRIDVDRAGHQVFFVGMKLNTSPKSGYIVTAVVNARIDGKGNFYAKLPRTHLSSISGHVMDGKVSGSFTIRGKGNKPQGTYTVVPRSDWPPAPRP